MSGEVYDIAVIGGGVNGCGIARDAAGRDLSVLLVEKNDLASGTSSASTKLIHGGLRYLERYELGLVRASLRERDALLSMAPHIVWPMRFVLPHHRGLRPRPLIRLGLILYDRLGGRRVLPASRHLNLGHDSIGLPLKDVFTHAFEYSDCWVDDSRLVVLNARDAALRGAQVRVRTKFVTAKSENDQWKVRLRDAASGTEEIVATRVLVNAAGPWALDVANGLARSNRPAKLRLVKGSHIVVPRLFEHDRAYIFQNADKRMVFAIPYERDFTLIGTTDVDFEGDPGAAAISSEEIAYLCSAVNEYLRSPVTPDDIVWFFSGVRPLYDDGDVSAQDVTRDYFLELDAPPGGPVLLNVFGGKITTYRRLAEAALTTLKTWLPRSGPAWTHGATLPGGDFLVDSFDALTKSLETYCAVLEPTLARRLTRAYGTLARDIVSGVKSLEDLGVAFGAGLYEREVEYLVREEWAMTTEDILWRRSKLGLRLDEAQVADLDSWLKANQPNSSASGA